MAVLVRGFDFGTSEEQLRDHLGSAGTIVSVRNLDQGSACVTFSSTEEAEWASSQFNETHIPGNKRYLEVLLLDPDQFLSEHNIEEEKVRQFFGMNPEQQQAVMAKGSLSSARDPTAVLVQRMKQVKGSGIGIAAFASAGKRSLAGRSSVLVRGFDFGTSEDMILSHMSSAGTVESLQWIDDGSVCITYSSADESKTAVADLQQTCIDGNKRYIDVITLDAKEFVAEHNIDVGRAEQFFAMTPEQQHQIMAKGTLATARDPTAVLVQRMQQVKAGGGKGSFGPAKGCGGGMAGGMGNGPYGCGGTGKGGGAGGGGGGTNQMQMMMMMQMMQMMTKMMSTQGR